MRSTPSVRARSDAPPAAPPSGYAAADAASAAVSTTGVTVRYGTRVVLDRVSVSIDAGQLVAIVGPNGAGKSTFFKALVGLVPVATGAVRLFGRPASQRHPALISYMAQRGEIDWRFPIRVEDVVLTGRYPHLGWGRRPGPDDRARVQAALERVGVADLAQRQVGQLSGGQQQRVFLARALAQEAALILLDEPFSGLDAVAEATMFHILAELQQAGVTILVATHDLNTVAAHFSSVIVLNRQVMGFGPVDEVFRPETLARAYGGQLTVLREDGAPVLAIGDGCGHFG